MQGRNHAFADSIRFIAVEMVMMPSLTLHSLGSPSQPVRPSHSTIIWPFMTIQCPGKVQR